MALSPLAMALQGVGFGPAAMAAGGFVPLQEEQGGGSRRPNIRVQLGNRDVAMTREDDDIIEIVMMAMLAADAIYD